MTVAEISAVDAVRALHSRRVFVGDGYDWGVCAECRQSWPCATIKVIRGYQPDSTEEGATRK